MAIYGIKCAMKLSEDEDRKWYAVYTKSHFERRVNEILKKKDVDTFLPTRKGKTKIAGAFRFAEIPLFRSYLFANISLGNSEDSKVLETSGVSSIVKNANKFCPVPGEVINSLKMMVEKMNSEITVITGIKRGERVRITKGLLEGAIGELVEIDNTKFRFIVNVEILGRAVEVLIPPEYVSKI